LPEVISLSRESFDRSIDIIKFEMEQSDWSCQNSGGIKLFAHSLTRPFFLGGSGAARLHLHNSGERNEAQRRTKLSLGRTMMQALELLRLAKWHVSGQSNVD